MSDKAEGGKRFEGWLVDGDGGGAVKCKSERIMTATVEGRKLKVKIDAKRDADGGEEITITVENGGVIIGEIDIDDSLGMYYVDGYSSR